MVTRIPQAKQFSTFENDSYVGNQGLCGVPLTRKCEEESGATVSPEEEDDDSDFVDGFVGNRREENNLKV
ncbi:hypothetical protein ACS0TY_028481 [Phlomoides rotata]